MKNKEAGAAGADLVGERVGTPKNRDVVAKEREHGGCLIKNIM